MNHKTVNQINGKQSFPHLIILYEYIVNNVPYHLTSLLISCYFI